MSFIAILKLSHSSYQIGVLSKGLSRKLVELKNEVEENDRATLFERLRKDLAEIARTYNIKQCYLSLSFQSVTAFILTLPLRKRNEIRKAVPYEIEDRLPLSINEYLVAFDILEQRGGYSDILVMVVSKKDTEQYINICNELGIKVKGIRITFVEILNDFIKTHKLRDKKTVFIHKDGGSYSAALLNSSKILSLRHFRNPEFLTKYLESMVKEEMTFYYSGPDNSPSEIMPCERIEYDFRTLSEAIFIRKKKVRIDFYITAGALYPSKYILGVTSLAMLSLLLYLFSVLIPYYIDYRELTDLQGKLKAIETEASDVLNMNRELDEVDRRLAELVILKNKGFRAIEALSALSKTLPEHSWIIMFKYNGQTIDISGFSERAIDILKSLEGSDKFKNVRFSSPIVTMQNKERFVIRMEIEQ